MIFWKKNIELFLRAFIVLDGLVMLVIFLNTQFGIEFPFPMPGLKLNNPLAFFTYRFIFNRLLESCFS